MLVRYLFGLGLMAWIALGPAALAAEMIVGVASNFAVPMQKIVTVFEKETGHKVLSALGSTGQFYAQIKQGAPFDLLLAADSEIPARLEQEGFGVKGTRFTYAIGQLVLWSAQKNLIDPAGKVLFSQRFKKLVIANPKVAPYGSAAIEVLTHLGLLTQLLPKCVMGQNIAQAYQMVVTQNAELGLVALSQIIQNKKASEGSAWLVPQTLYSPIRQQAILLKKGEKNQVARTFLHYLRTPKIQRMILSYGYSL